MVRTPDADDAPGRWCVYLLECRSGAYYAGITNRLDARYAAHVAGTGAKYTRANPPVQLLASRAYPDRSAASRAEAHLKRLPRAKKLAFFES
ncbi:MULTISPECIES: GIY-YIG nuclease family protein [unclassified Pseudoxanthomonas]|uniref:GIY-YIG nuclease family protein n=1 Tax=unclassified Pseudoxanthomonas TaxID=2645906 RepID=UPI003F4FFDC0